MAKKIKRTRGRATSTDDENSDRIPLASIIVDDLTGDISFFIVNTSNNDGSDTHIFVSEESDLGFAKEIYIYSERDTGSHTIALVSGSSIKQAIVIIEDDDAYSGSNYRERFDALLITPINGTQSGNLLIGTDFGDAVYGRSGNDVVLGIDGENSLYGWQDHDLLIGGSRPDLLVGSSGNDTLYGGANVSADYRRFIGVTDLLDGGAGNDFLDGGSGIDELYGGVGKDTLFGGSGKDTVEGEEGDDLLDGGKDADRLVGGRGNDSFVIDDEGDRAYENNNGGIDTVISSVSYYFGGIEGGEIGGLTLPDQVVENLILRGKADLQGAGNALDNEIVGNAGANDLFGFDGNDQLVGDNRRFKGGDADTLYGGNGNDTLLGGQGTDTLWGGAGADAFVFLTPDDGRDEIGDFQFAEGDKIYVSLRQFGNVAGDLSQFTYSPSRRILSFQGKAIARFQPGVNFLIDFDIVLTNNLPTGLANSPKTSAGKVSGSAKAETLVDNDQDGSIQGGKGNDVIAGMEGNDSLSGDKGEDVLDGGLGADQIRGGEDGDRLFGEFGNDRLSGDSGNDYLSGGRDVDTLSGGAGQDVLYGGEDNDVLTGGSGKDWFTFYHPANVDVTIQQDGLGNVTEVQLKIFQNDPGVLSALPSTQFQVGKVALDETDRVLYDDATGLLYFDADGTSAFFGAIGSARPIPIAQLPAGLSLSADQILAPSLGFEGSLTTHKPASDGIDRIKDFNTDDDVIGIYVGSKMVSVYSAAGLEPNAVLRKSQFKTGDRATKASHRFIYNDTNGYLYFDRDGTGALAPVAIAKLDKKPNLSYQNIRTFDDNTAQAFGSSGIIATPPTDVV